MAKIFANLTYERELVNKNCQIYCKDCRTALKELAENSVDCIITDPPYFIDGMGNEWNDTALKNRALRSGVVGGLPVKKDVKSKWLRYALLVSNAANGAVLKIEL